MNVSNYSQHHNLSNGSLIVAVCVISMIVGWVFTIGFFISVVLPITMACLTWWRINKKHKSISHALLGVILVFILFWIGDRYGQRTLPDDYSIYRLLFYIFIPIILSIYLSIAIDKDINEFISLVEQPLPDNWWRGWAFFISIFIGGISLAIGLNYGAKQLGFCEFPPAYYLFSPDIEPKDGVKVGLINPYDFECKFFYRGSALASKFDDPIINSFQVPFEQAHSRYMPGKYIKGSDTVFINQYIWVTKNEITSADIQTAMSFDSRSEGALPISDINLVEIPGARFQSINCYKDSLWLDCEFAIGFTYILTKFRIGIYEDMGTEILEEIVNTAAVKIGERLLIIDKNLP